MNLDQFNPQSQSSYTKDIKHNPILTMKIYDKVNCSDPIMLGYLRMANQAISQFTIKQNSFVYRIKRQLELQIFIVPEKEAMLGKITDFKAELLMKIRLQQKYPGQISNYLFNASEYQIQFQKYCQEAIKQKQGTMFYRQVYRSIYTLGYMQKFVSPHKLQKGDMIYDRQTKYKVVTFGAFETPEQYQKFKNILPQNYTNGKFQFVKGVCRICLSDEHTLQNPLVSPCQCSGSCRYIHLDCLHTWINQKLIINRCKKHDIYIWQKFKCEICKKFYLNTILCNSISYLVPNFNYPYTRFVVLQVLTNSINNQCRKFIVLSQFQKPWFSQYSQHRPYMEFSIDKYHDINMNYGKLLCVKPIEIKDNVTLCVGDICIQLQKK